MINIGLNYDFFSIIENEVEKKKKGAFCAWKCDHHIRKSDNSKKDCSDFPLYYEILLLYIHAPRVSSLILISSCFSFDSLGRIIKLFAGLESSCRNFKATSC